MLTYASQESRYESPIRHAEVDGNCSEEHASFAIGST